jgi:predicted RNase H-like nuclease
MKQIFKITYPTGKIFIGHDPHGRIDFLGNPDNTLLTSDFANLPHSKQRDYTVRKEVLWQTQDCSSQELAAKQHEFITSYQSDDPEFGYNKWSNNITHTPATDTGYRIGVDGCRAGWFYVSQLGNAPCKFGIVATLAELFDIYEIIEEIIVDIPIGLFDDSASPRACDIEARRQLSPRGSTVFPEPLRPCLTANNYDEACAVSKRLSGKSLSKQAYNIFNKIHEVDALLRKEVRHRNIVKEAHPELGFCFLNNGKPLLSRKKDLEGLVERLSLLDEKLPFAKSVYAKALSTFPRKQLAKDDVVDALMCLAISLTPIGNRRTLPSTPDVDSFGLEICMHYAFSE